MVQLTVRRVGNSLAIILPDEATQALGVEDGDILFLTESAEGFQLRTYEPEFRRQMEAAENCMQRYRSAIRELADR